MGEAVFGVAPGRAEIWTTLRTRLDERMDGLVADAEKLARDAARAHGLGCAFDYHEIFVASLNAPEAITFGHRAKSAMFFLGAGENHPALHNPDYDFPDDLIAIGARVFLRTVRNMLG